MAWTLCGASVALLIPVVVLILLNRSVHGIWSDIEVQHLVGGFIAVGVGFVLATRRPDNAVGWLLLVSALIGQLSILAALWGIYGVESDPVPVGAAAVLWLSLPLGLVAGAPLMTFSLLLFPNGRFPDRRARVVAALTAIVLIFTAVSLIGAEGADLPTQFPSIILRTPNPMAAYVPFSDPGIGILALGICGLLSVALLLARLRAASGRERQQYKLIVSAMVQGYARGVAPGAMAVAHWGDVHHRACVARSPRIRP